MDARAFEQLWMALGRNPPVALHGNLIALAGSAKAALFLSQLAYWTRRSEAAHATGGWLHKSAAQWYAELGLSRREQDTARHTLRALCLLEEERRGFPALPYYRLPLVSLGHQLGALLSLPTTELTLEAFLADETLVRRLLGRTIPYHRVLAYLTESVNAALLLTRILYSHRRHMAALGWSPFRREELERQLGLTRWEQESARMLLREARFIEERLEYLPVRLCARALPEQLLPRLLSLTPGRGAPMPSRYKLIVRNSDNREVQKRQTGCPNSGQTRGGKAPNRFSEFRRTSLAENLLSINGLTTEVNTTTTAREQLQRSSDEVVVVVDESKGRTAVGAVPDCPTGGQSPRQPHTEVCANTGPHCLTVRQSELILPKDFLPAERELALQALAEVAPERRQLILDEIEGRQRKGRRIDSRLNLIRALVQAEHQERFTPGYAWEVRAARARSARLQAERHAGEQCARAETEALRADLAERLSGKTGYEAFKELAAHLHGPRRGRTLGRSGDEDSA